MLSLTPFRGQRLRQCVKWLTKWNTSESEQKLHVTIRKLTETNCNYTGNVLSFSPLSSLVSFRGCILNIISLFMSVLLYGHTEEGSRLRIWGDFRSIPQNTLKVIKAQLKGSTFKKVMFIYLICQSFIFISHLEWKKVELLSFLFFFDIYCGQSETN